MTVQPTFHCFDDALDYPELVIKNRHELHKSTLLVVHGICLMPDDGRPYAHAWVENPKKGECIFKGIIGKEEAYLFADKADFYKEMQVQETTKYTVKQACIENMKHETFGPWEEKYLKLTSNYKK